MKDMPLPWLQKSYVPLALTLIATTAAFCYLELHAKLGGEAYSVFGWAAALGPPVFIGLLAGLGRPQAPVRHALSLTALTMLAVAPVFGEGFGCIVVLTPIYLVATSIIALLARAVLRWAAPWAQIGLLLLPGAWFLVDRPVPAHQLPLQTISDAVVLDAEPAAVWAALDRLDLTFAPPDGFFGGWGLPIPQRVLGRGAHVGAERRVVFHNGTLVGRVTASQAPRLFALTLTTEPAGREFFDHWAVLEDTVFELEPLPGGRTLFRHTTRYRRLIRPRIYFEQVEQLGAHYLQGELLAAFGRVRIAPLAPMVASR